ncbi:hypothetical protein NXC24_PA00276 (plasmid) [Rhizobium sp. NXC24]|nr:hypothetical protein NXC24_PA00276 [Rhizobium sp. NXC24]
MLMKLALTVFAGSVLGFLALPDHDAGLRMLGFSTAFLIATFAVVRVIELLARGIERRQFRPRQQPARFNDELPFRNPSEPDWSTSGVDPNDLNLVWQYRLNDLRLGRFEL